MLPVSRVLDPCAAPRAAHRFSNNAHRFQNRRCDQREYKEVRPSCQRSEQKAGFCPNDDQPDRQKQDANPENKGTRSMEANRPLCERHGRIPCIPRVEGRSQDKKKESTNKHYKNIITLTRTCHYPRRVGWVRLASAACAHSRFDDNSSVAAGADDCRPHLVGGQARPRP